MAKAPPTKSQIYSGNRNDFKSVWSAATLTWGLKMAGDVAILEDKDGHKRTFVPGDKFTVTGGKIIKSLR